MIPETTLQLVQYYANLLIYQYQALPRAYNTIISSVTPAIMAQQSVQTISFSPAPTSGTFVLSYNGINSSSIAWNDSVSTIQSVLQAISGLEDITVSGSISSGLTINFVGVIGVALLLEVFSNTLTSSGSSVSITIIETDLTLPLAVQNGYNISTAVGIQLEILGKYTGVSRTISTPNQTITLDDDDFRTLITFAAIQNNSGSSLSIIENNLNQFFSGKFIVTDYKTMYMSYIFSQSIGSINLFIALVQEKLIPKPMGVGLTVINPPVLNQYFGYGTYENKNINSGCKPYNTYESFDTNWFYLDYNDFIN